MGLPLNLKGHSHFLILDKLGSVSHLYFLYFPPFSQPNNTWIFLSGCPLYLYDIRIITTNPRLKATPETHSIKSSPVGKISLVVN